MAEADAEAGFENGSGWNVLAGHKGAGSPEFQKLRKKNLVTSALSWFKVLRATSMNQKFPYILRISEKACRSIFYETRLCERNRGGGSHVRRCMALCLIGADVQHQGEADLFPGKGGELWASLWQEA
jgi:hypothetical protein